MTQAFDMELFLSGVLKGSIATRDRHLRQALAIQIAMRKRWNRDNPWTWRAKHLKWFFEKSLTKKSPSTHYYYWLTARLITKRMGRSQSMAAQISRYGLPAKSVSMSTKERAPKASKRVRGLRSAPHTN